MKRRSTTQVKITDNLWIGSEHPIAVQSMTNTPTADVVATTAQIIELYQAGSALVRITVKDEESAKLVPEIVSRLESNGFNIPIVGDFHYNGHLLLSKYPSCAQALAKYRINPGNVGHGDKHDYNFETIIKVATKFDKPVRIGVNWGSLDQDLLTEFMNVNSKRPEIEKKSFKEIVYDAMLASALRSAELAVSAGLAKDKIIISVKMSEVEDLINVYRLIAKACDYPLHLGLTEAGSPVKGMIASAAAMGILLQEGIGDTIRMSLTPLVHARDLSQDPEQIKPSINLNLGQLNYNVNSSLSERSLEVKACQELLQALGLKFFKPDITSCPGCGRTSSTYFQSLAEEINDHVQVKINEWKVKYPGVEKLKIAVMGCIVNGPGESKYADIGISLPGDNEEPSAPVFIDGKLYKTLRGEDIAGEFKDILDNYVSQRFANHSPAYNLRR